MDCLELRTPQFLSRLAGTGRVRAQDGHLLDEGGLLSIRPDLVIADEARVLAVADAK